MEDVTDVETTEEVTTLAEEEEGQLGSSDEDEILFLYDSTLVSLGVIRVYHFCKKINEVCFRQI